MGVVVAPAPALPSPPPPIPAPRPKTLTLTLTLTTTTVRRSLLSSSSALILSSVLLAPSSSAAVLLAPSSSAAAAEEAAEEAPSPPPPMLRGFEEIPGSGGVKALELRAGSGRTPVDGDQVAIHYYGRLGAKQGWRFDSTYDHKDAIGDPVPFVFVVGSAKVIPGIEAAVKSMRVGGVCRVIIPPSQGYQNTSQEPIPPNFFDRQRLFTTIFNPTRLANGEGSTLGTLIFDIELLSVRRP